MNTMAAIKTLLGTRIGVVPDTLGPESIERAVVSRMLGAQLQDPTRYLQILTDTPDEMSKLIDEIVVTESWFFRDNKPFEYLAKWVKGRKSNDGFKAKLRVLSAPCAGGEEPFSIVMTLLDLGLTPLDFTVNAVDISQKQIDLAGKQPYGVLSFRGDQLAFRDKISSDKVQTNSC